MSEPNYWIIVGSPDNFAITREHGFTIQGIKLLPLFSASLLAIPLPGEPKCEPLTPQGVDPRSSPHLHAGPERSGCTDPA